MATAVLAVALALLPGSTCAQRGSEQESENEAQGQEQERKQEVESDRGGAGVERESEVGTEREAAHGERGLDAEPDMVLALDLSERSLAAARKLGFRVIEEDQLRGLGFRLTQLSTPGGIPLQAAVERLRKADPRGNYDINPRYFTAGGEPCAGIRCDAQKLVGWPASGCQAEARIGMVDGAVETRSPALAGSRLQQRHFGNSGASPEGAEHGTEVATIFAGRVDAGFAGLTPQAQLFAANVFDFSHDHGPFTNAVLIARGMDWLAEQRPGVINVAIAGPDNAVLHETVQRLVQRGIPLVAAAGNLGPAGPARYPAAYPEVIAVTAVDGERHIYAQANHGAYIDLAAPGVHIWSAGADGHGRFVDGTSFATPFVAADVALMHAAEPQRTPAELKDQVRRHAMPLDAAGSDSVYGAGLLQAHGCRAAIVRPN